MELPVAGLFTPWARKDDDFSWTPITTAPQDNLKLYALEPNQIHIALQKLFNQPLPFLGVISPVQLTSTQVQDALEGSEYELYDTIAVYNQNDKSPTPAESYFYWISMGPEGDKNTKSMASAVALLKGQLVLPARVPYLDTALRAFPAASFEEAQNTKLTEVSENDLQDFENPEVAPTPTSTQNTASGPPLFTMLLVGGALCAATVYVGKAMNK
jgi:hypothetical protein